MTNPSPNNTSHPWTRQQIRAARQVHLAPLLQKRGFFLRDRGGGNAQIQQYPGLVFKESYWRWPQRNLTGNAIDFCMKILGLSFSDAMKALSEK